MHKVAVLDDYQNIAKDFIDLKKLSSKYEFQVFNDLFENEDDAIEKLKEFEVLFIMRERTKITKKLIESLKKLKLIVTSGMRNKSIDLEIAKKNKVVVCGTEINSNPTPELTWALILNFPSLLVAVPITLLRLTIFTFSNGRFVLEFKIVPLTSVTS